MVLYTKSPLGINLMDYYRSEQSFSFKDIYYKPKAI